MDFQFGDKIMYTGNDSFPSIVLNATIPIPRFLTVRVFADELVADFGNKENFFIYMKHRMHEFVKAKDLTTVEKELYSLEENENHR
jgi:hypothetical protein